MTHQVKRNDIQCIRGIAIIYVLSFHLFPAYVSKGFIGVDIFFVLSGFLMTQICLKETINVQTILKFYQRRTSRILPAYLTISVATLIVAKYLLIPTDLHALVIDQLWSLTFVSNFQPLFQDTSYFAQVNEYKFMLHTWSLSVEMQFYCISPFIFLFYQRSTSFRLVPIALLFATSLCIHLMPLDPNVVFYFFGSRIWQFLCGTFAYLVMMQQQTSNEPIDKKTDSFVEKGGDFKFCPPILTVLVFVSLLLIFVFFLPFTIDQKLSRLFSVFSTSCLLAYGVDEHLSKPLASLLNNRLLRFIGDISYSVYLVHWPLLLFYKYATLANATQPMRAASAIPIVAATFAFAYCSYRYLELKLTHFAAKRTFTFAILIYAINFWMIFHINHMRSASDNWLSTSLVDKTNRTTYDRQNLSSPEDEEQARIAKYIGTMPFRCVSHINESQIESIGHECLRVSKYGNGSYCTIMPDHNSNNIDTRLKQAEILIVGDSHAHRQYYAINYAIQGAFAFRTLNLFGTMSCSYLLDFDDGDDRCINYRKYMRLIIERMKPDYLFFIAHMEGHIATFVQRAMAKQLSGDAIQDELCALYQQTIAFAERNTRQQVVLVYPTPLHAFDVPAAIARARRMRRSLDELRINIDEYRSMTQRSRTCLDRIRCEKCIRFYAQQAFCDDAYCALVDAQQRTLFGDTTHLSTFGIVHMQPLYRQLFANLTQRYR